MAVARRNRRALRVFENPNQPLAQRLEDLIGRLTLDEKVPQLRHDAPAIPRLGIPAYNWASEALHGVARAGKATVFPQAIGMAASFDSALLKSVADVISTELRAKHHAAARLGNRGMYFGLTVWSPNINIFRDPRWGRGQETYGEDPYLTGRMGVAFVSGIQGEHPRYLKGAAAAKHFAVHSGPEPQRHSFDAVVSPRDLHETYLPAFKALVQEGHVETVMGAYNRTNGVPCCAHPLLLQKILRDAWGFKGHVVSDLGAVEDILTGHKICVSAEAAAVMAIESGCDLNCGEFFYGHLVESVRQGRIEESVVDTALQRLFRTRFRLGMFDPPARVPYARIKPSVVNQPRHVALARRMARESIVLLKNEGDLLPLHRRICTLAVVGPTAYRTDVLHGNYTGHAPRMSTLLQGLLEKLSPGTKVVHHEGCELAGAAPIDKRRLGWTLSEADVIIACLGLSPALEGEEGDTFGQPTEFGGDRGTLGLPGRQEELLQFLHASGKPVVLIVTGGSPIDLAWAKANIPAILMAWYPGQEGGAAVADSLFGDHNPAGRLPVTFYKSLDQVPTFTDYAMKGRTYRFMAAEPLYRFGYGLSYTRFVYSNLKLSQRTMARQGGVKVSVDVTNKGSRAGDEVAQLYVSDIEATVPVPLRHLEGFRRFRLKACEKRRISFLLKASQLAAYDDEGRPFVESGEFLVSVGGGQPDDPASHALTVSLRVP